MPGGKIVRILVAALAFFLKPISLPGVNVRFDAGFSVRDQPGVPQGQRAKDEKRPGREKSFESYQGMSGEYGKVFIILVPLDLFPKNLEAKDHDKETSEDGVDHVEEEVSVIVVADAVIEPGTVVIHL